MNKLKMILLFASITILTFYINSQMYSDLNSEDKLLIFRAIMESNRIV